MTEEEQEQQALKAYLRYNKLIKECDVALSDPSKWPDDLTKLGPDLLIKMIKNNILDLIKFEECAKVYLDPSSKDYIFIHASLETIRQRQDKLCTAYTAHIKKNGDNSGSCFDISAFEENAYEAFRLGTFTDIISSPLTQEQIDSIRGMKPIEIIPRQKINFKIPSS